MANTDDLVRQIGEVIDQKLEARLKPMEARLDGLEKEQKKQGKDLKKIKKTLDIVIDHFDNRTLDNTKRIQRLEHHVGI